MRNPRPFVVIQNGKPIFTVYAYTAQQVRTLVAARLADTTGVLIVAPCKAQSIPDFGEPRVRRDDPRYPQWPSRDGMCLSDAEGDQAQHGT